MNTNMIIKLAVAGGLVFAGMKYAGMAQNKAIGTALVAVGASALVRNVPIVNQYV